MSNYRLRFIGTGNAWPVLISEAHPFYDGNSEQDLANSTYIVEREEDGCVSETILIDAGFGVIPFLIRNQNRLPDAVVLTHAHLDHTASLDWIVNSYFKKFDKKRKLPVYCSRLCYETLINCFPQLVDKMEFRELIPGESTRVCETEQVSLTAYPVYHGIPARGAYMIRLDISGQKKILFTGDCLCPVLRDKDPGDLRNIPILITDANNRFPYPGSNHWSVLCNGPEHYSGTDYLEEFRKTFGPSQVLATQLAPDLSNQVFSYFDQWLEERGFEKPVLSISGFCNLLKPGITYLVHYGGAEDEKYYQVPRMSKKELISWVEKLHFPDTILKIPFPGEVIPIL